MFDPWKYSLKNLLFILNNFLQKVLGCSWTNIFENSYLILVKISLESSCLMRENPYFIYENFRSLKEIYKKKIMFNPWKKFLEIPILILDKNLGWNSRLILDKNLKKIHVWTLTKIIDSLKNSWKNQGLTFEKFLEKSTFNPWQNSMKNSRLILDKKKKN